MLSLIKFELKKMLTRRVAVAANAGAIVMLVAVMALNVMQARAEGNAGEILSGPEAIAHRREVAEARAGELTPERVAADIAHYQEIAYERLNPEELADMSDAAAYEAVAEAYDEATRLELYDPYYITLLKPWAVRGLEPYQYAFRVTPEMALDFYGALAASLQDSLDEGMGGEWVSRRPNARSGPRRRPAWPSPSDTGGPAAGTTSSIARRSSSSLSSPPASR